MAIVLLGVFCVLAGETGSASAWGNVPLQTKIPELSLPSTTGQKVTISVATAKALLLLYIRPNHDKSAAALADLVRLFGKYQGQKVKALAVSTVRQDAEAVRALARKLKVPFPVLIDMKEEFYGRFGVFVHPVTGVVDGKGILRYEYSSHRPDYLITVERQLKAVLGLGPPPGEYRDIDRNDVSPAELKKRRQDKMEEMERKMELMRARRRLTGAQAILAPENLEMVLKLYADWAVKLPAPEDKALAAAAEQVPVAKGIAGIISKLHMLAAEKATRAEAQLWLGRALLRVKQAGEAQKSFQACVGQPSLQGQCSFELCQLLARTDTAMALAHCKKGFEALQAETGH